MSSPARSTSRSPALPADFVSMLAREHQAELIREAAERRLAGSLRLPPRTRRRFLRWP